jgi:hypothetical protein
MTIGSISIITAAAGIAALLRIVLFHRLLIFPETHFRVPLSVKDQEHQNQKNNNPTPAKGRANAKNSFYCEAHEFKRKQDEPTDKKDYKIIPNVIMAHLLYEDNYILFHIFVTDYFCKIGEVAINLANSPFFIFNLFLEL